MRPLGVLWSLSLLVTACAEAPDQFLKGTHGMADGALTLTTDRFILRFDGIEVAPRLRNEVQLMIGGGRNGGLRSSIQDVQLFSKYSGGVATVTLDRIPAFALRLREGGRLAEVDGLTIDLSGRRRTIIVHEDGAASVR